MSALARKLVRITLYTADIGDAMLSDIESAKDRYVELVKDRLNDGGYYVRLTVDPVLAGIEDKIELIDGRGDEQWIRGAIADAWAEWCEQEGIVEP